MRSRGSLLCALGGLAVLGTAGCGVTCDSTVRIAGMPVIAAGSFDGVEADQAAHRLYLADRQSQGVDVVDMAQSTPRFVGTVGVGGAPSGLAVAPDQHRVYAAVQGGTVAVVDTEAMKLAGTIKVDPANADLLDYSPKTKNLYVGSGTNIVVVDTSTQQVTRTLAANSPVEQPRYDPADGMVYATTPGTDSLLRIDPSSGRVTRTYVIAKCHPAGLAINPGRRLAMLGCGSSIALVNLSSGAHDVTRAVQGADIVSYDPGADRFVVASPHDAADSTVGVFTGGGEFVGAVSASPTAHAAAYDDAHGVVYAPGKGGLMSFSPVACAPPPDWLRFLGGLSVFAAPLLAAGGLLAAYAWWRGRRRSVAASRPTYEQLLEEDLAFERERMRALEDGILGPETAP